MQLEPVINSPPMFLLAPWSAGSTTEALHEGQQWPAVLEATLAWTAVINWRAVSQLNFIFASFFDGGPDERRLEGDQWQHVAVQAEYARTAQRLSDALLPDVTDNRTELSLRLVEGTQCRTNGSGWLPPSHGHTARRAGSVAMRGFRGPLGGGFCAYIVVVNLCADPTHYTLELPAELPERVRTAQHQFRAVRNVSLDGRRLADELEGFGSAVLRVGCAE